MEVDALRNLGQKSRFWLAGVGITNVEQLRKVGAPTAYGLVKYNFGAGPSLNLLYALEGALTNRDCTTFSVEEKRRLCEAAGVAFNSKPRRRLRR